MSELASRPATRHAATCIVTPTQEGEITATFECIPIMNDGTAAEKMRALVERPIIIGNCETHTGISIGWALCPANGTDTETLLKTADQRMFQDKTRRKQNKSGTLPNAAP